LNNSHQYVATPFISAGAEAGHHQRAGLRGQRHGVLARFLKVRRRAR
jgi:hypothetical protein